MSGAVNSSVSNFSQVYLLSPDSVSYFCVLFVLFQRFYAVFRNSIDKIGR